MFEQFSCVFAARVVTDRASGYSKGFGFVRYATLDGAAEGIKGMDGKVRRRCLISKYFLDVNTKLLVYQHEQTLHTMIRRRQHSLLLDLGQTDLGVYIFRLLDNHSSVILRDREISNVFLILLLLEN